VDIGYCCDARSAVNYGLIYEYLLDTEMFFAIPGLLLDKFVWSKGWHKPWCTSTSRHRRLRRSCISSLRWSWVLFGKNARSHQQQLHTRRGFSMRDSFVHQT